ncbi:uncharacterized protein B0T15DRAFT_289308 [Chaetomium strumarium]|uniref:Uncharacterized protein n=1 Tax=Chaetomium strumarium TaxID=1170767 RepID=A0AAJ0GL97_9PEZI|nr:hypothetical protein B0T15DRAFT_289308 [Chaetomium strumarium]
MSHPPMKHAQALLSSARLTAEVIHMTNRSCEATAAGSCDAAVFQPGHARLRLSRLSNHLVRGSIRRLPSPIPNFPTRSSSVVDRPADHTTLKAGMVSPRCPPASAASPDSGWYVCSSPRGQASAVFAHANPTLAPVTNASPCVSGVQGRPQGSSASRRVTGFPGMLTPRNSALTSSSAKSHCLSLNLCYNFGSCRPRDHARVPREPELVDHSVSRNQKILPGPGKNMPGRAIPPSLFWYSGWRARTMSPRIRQYLASRWGHSGPGESCKWLT